MGLNFNSILIFLSCALTISSSLPFESGKCSLKCLIPIDVDIKCGSDGISYQNIEELECARERCFPDLTLGYDGKCRTTFQIDPASTSTQTPSPDLHRPHSKPRPKSEFSKIHFAPKDSETYGNGPHRQANSLVPVSTRPIKPKSGPAKDDFECNADDCVCDLVLAPVCGSNGVTYGNYCILDCIRKCDPVVSFHHGGFCGKIFFPLDRIPFFRVLKMTE